MAGAAATLSMTFATMPPWPVWAYVGVGVLVTAYYFWQEDDQISKGERHDIALAFPFLVWFWPVLALVLPFLKTFKSTR